MLNEHGLRCTGIDDIARAAGLNNGNIVDVDRLSKVHIDYDIIESHYSHLLDCTHVIILVDDNETLRNRMEKRGYSREKINENLDAQMAEVIYYESLDRLPADRIYMINECSRNIEDIYKEVIYIISMINNDK